MTKTQASLWFKTGALMVAGFGVLIGLGPYPVLGDALVEVTDALMWPIHDMPPEASVEFRFLSAVCGGVMVGWGVLLWQLAGRGMAEAPALSVHLIKWSAISWFVVDSVGSAFVFTPLNIIGNLVFLAVFLVPALRVKL